jgi:hypothetical protein
MVITHHGGQCFKVTFGDLTLVFDPIAKGATLPPVRFGDIASYNATTDMNGIEEVAADDTNALAVTGPNMSALASLFKDFFLIAHMDLRRVRRKR